MPEATQSELQAILHGAAIALINEPGYEAFARGTLRITGPDATRWLNGMVTNSVQSLQPGEGNYNFLLNAQGRIQADCTIYRESREGDPSFLLETGSSQLEAVRDILDRYIIIIQLVTFLQPSILVFSSLLFPVHGLRLFLITSNSKPCLTSHSQHPMDFHSLSIGSILPLPLPLRLLPPPPLPPTQAQ